MTNEAMVHTSMDERRLHLKFCGMERSYLDKYGLDYVDFERA